MLCCQTHVKVPVIRDGSLMAHSPLDTKRVAIPAFLTTSATWPVSRYLCLGLAYTLATPLISVSVFDDGIFSTKA